MPHVTFVHGIGNKPPEEELLGIWERALAYGEGFDLGTRGITSRMVYWADVLYPEPSAGEFESTEEVPAFEQAAVELSWRNGLEGRERNFVAALGEQLAVDDDPPEASEDEIGVEFERIPLPNWLKQRLMASLLRDVHHYLFNSAHVPRPGEQYQVQDEIRRRMVEALQAGSDRPGPHVVVSHSMGTVIAYDTLKRVPECPQVDGLITIGSPLGRREIPDELQPDWSADDGFPSDRLRGPWINVFDHFDPVVGVLPHLTRLYRRSGEDAVVDVNEQNWGKWRHNISKYLRGPQLRENLVQLLSG
jgi:predicted alpha/beta hydrolase family esterase